MTFTQQIQTRHPKVSSSKPRIAWLLNDWEINDFRKVNDLYGGIGYYRVICPSRALRKDFDIEVVGADFQHWGTTDETYTRLGRDYDLIITKPLLEERKASNLLATAKYFNRKVIVDMDDNYLALRKGSTAFNAYDVGQKQRGVTGALLELSDGLIVSTEPLKKAYSKFNKVDVLPNCVEISEWPKPQFKNDGKIRIGFAGGIDHKPDLEMILEPLAYILAKHSNVILEICGALDPQTAMEMANTMNDYCKKDISKQFRITGATEGGVWLGYPEMLNSFSWDIVIAPLIDDTFNQGKSHIRWMEASLIGAAVVASPVYPYIQDIQGVKVIEHGKTGFFAATSVRWFEYLEALINDEKLRRTIAENAFNYIKDNWTSDKWVDKWKKTINKYL